jgi:nitrogen fixation protein NifB
MPLIAEAEHGTFFGVMGQRGPTHDELQLLQDACSGDMNMMRHCRQCRADAVGLLGEDRGEEFTMDKIEAMDIDYDSAMVRRAEIHAAIADELDAKKNKPKDSLVTLSSIKKETRPVLMAVATTGGGVINQHFGHATEFLIYEANSTDVRFISHRKVDELYCAGTDADGVPVLQRIIETLKGCEAVLCSKVGFEPWGMLEEAGIMPNGEHGMEDIESAVAEVYKEMAESGALDDEPMDEKELATA